MNQDYPTSERPVVQEVKIEFKNLNAIIDIKLTKGSITIKLKYNDEKFMLAAEKKLKEKEIGVLDIVQINSLYQIKLIDHLLVKTIKKGMSLIIKLDSAEITRDIKRPIQSTDDKLKIINDKVRMANSWAETLIAEMEIKFKDINDKIEASMVNFSDRTVLLKKCKEEIFDNIYKKHALVINEIIHFVYEYEELPKIFTDEEEGLVKEYIYGLQSS